MKRILVTGAGGSAAANFIKSLRLEQERFYVVGVDRQPYHLELADVDARYLVPAASDPGYIDAVNRIVAREGIEFVHPQPDPEVAALSEGRERLHAATFLPSREALRTCQDKMALAGALCAAGVPVGESVRLTDRAGLREGFARLRERHERVWLRATSGAGGRASLPVTRVEQAEAWIDYWQEMRGLSVRDFMLVEFLPGKEFAFQSLWLRGRLITSQARERLQYLFGYLTPSGQTSSPSVAVTVHRDDVNDIASRAVKAAAPDATGVFCVDLKENAAGVPCVTEINAGRFFTTSNFLAEAGCNMPYYYVKLAYGEPVPDLPQFNAVPAGYYWVRMMDMGHRLVKGEQWSSQGA
jgi:carbamoyl-phosphate synthase large subunit